MDTTPFDLFHGNELIGDFPYNGCVWMTRCIPRGTGGIVGGLSGIFGEYSTGEDGTVDGILETSLGPVGYVMVRLLLL